MSIRYATYAAIPGINWTTLKNAATSAFTYKYFVKHASPDTAARLFGRAVHAMTLEPEEFDADWVITDLERRGTNDWKSFVAKHPGKEIVKRRELDKWTLAVEAVMEHPEAAELLDGSYREQIMRWTDEVTGLACKGRIDAMSGRGMPDLKTCGKLKDFPRDIERMRYDAQIAFYHDGLLSAQGLDLHPYIIAVESKPPHEVGVFDMAAGLENGRRHYRELLEVVKKCTESDEWPGRCPGITEYIPSAYMYPDPDDEIIFPEDEEGANA